MREVLTSLLRFVFRPAVVGGLYVLGLAAYAGSVTPGDDQHLGRQAAQLRSFVEGAYGSELTRITIAIVASAVVIGGALGFVAGVLGKLRRRLNGLPRRSFPRRLVESLAVTIALHGAIFLWGMAKSPQLYAERWYAQGGALRTVQVLTTDVLGTGGVAALAVLSLLVYLAGPPRRWREWPGRVARAVRPLGLARLAAVGGALLALLLVPALASRGAERPVFTAVAHAAETPQRRPNVLILAADSLRADRIDPRVAPTLHALGERGTRFDHAYVSLPRTFGSWVTILTGRHPHTHGIRGMFPRREERERDFDALPQRFAKAGYWTGVVADFAGDMFTRIDLGFGYENTAAFDFRQLVRQRGLERETPLLPLLHSDLGHRAFPVLRVHNHTADPQMLTRDALSALGRAGKDQPFFLVVFYSTAHFPYAAPAPYYAKFTDPAYRGRYKYHKPVGLGSEAPADDADIRQVRGLFDGAINAIDDAAGALLAGLARQGKLDDTIVVVTGDHGETLFENDHGLGHGDHLFGDEGTHVPLLVVDPRRKAPHHEPAVVRDVDIAPTLYDLAGIAPPQDLDGRSLASAVDGKPLSPALAFAETELWFTEEVLGLPAELRIPYPGVAGITEVDAAHGDEIVMQKSMSMLTRVAKHRMVRDERFKLLYVPTRKGVRYMLFDTKNDPGEVKDVAGTKEGAEPLERLKAELWRWMLRDPDMTERGGYLLPRTLGRVDEAGGLRLGDFSKEPGK